MSFEIELFAFDRFPVPVRSLRSLNAPLVPALTIGVGGAGGTGSVDEHEGFPEPEAA